ncbi:MAG: type IV secretion system protein [Steroidobacteraceae bacterium]
MRSMRQMRYTWGLLLAAAAPAAHAQWAVIDVAAVARLSAELQTLEQSLSTEQQQFFAAEAQLRGMSGTRGMQDLLTGIRRNYLPENWAQLRTAAEGSSGSYPGLSSAVREAVAAHAYLSPGQLQSLSPSAQQQLAANRRTAALLEAISASALSDASARFSGLKQLIATIGTAQDQKSILDLTARIGAEQTMLENEQTKLRVLFAAAQAERWIDHEREREAAIAAQGNFATRFRPTP